MLAEARDPAQFFRLCLEDPAKAFEAFEQLVGDGIGIAAGNHVEKEHFQDLVIGEMLGAQFCQFFAHTGAVAGVNRFRFRFAVHGALLFCPMFSVPIIVLQWAEKVNSALFYNFQYKKQLPNKVWELSDVLEKIRVTRLVLRIPRFRQTLPLRPRRLHAGAFRRRHGQTDSETPAERYRAV